MGGSKGIGSRQRSEAPTITCTTNQAQAYELSNLSSELSHTRAHTHRAMPSFISLERYSNKKKTILRKKKLWEIKCSESRFRAIFLVPHQAESQQQLHLQQFPLKESLGTEYPTEFAGIHSDWKSGVGQILANF